MNTYPEGSNLTEVRGGGTNLHPQDTRTSKEDNLSNELNKFNETKNIFTKPL